METLTLRQTYRNIYWAWKAMKQRCLNPKCKAYQNYGARGIGICDPWMEFEPFCEWALNNGYTKGSDIDRIDNDGDYTPENCRWIDRRTNVNNRRVTTMLTVKGETRSRTEWEDIAGISSGTIKQWVSAHGKEYAESRIEEALEVGYIPKDYSRNHRYPVVCIESGHEFPSIKSASRELGIAYTGIRNSISKGWKVSGLHFKRIEKELL